MTSRPASFAFLCRPGSPLGARVLELAGGGGILLALPERVQVEDCSVLWNGTRLDGLATLVLEEPWISWPQPVAELRAGEDALELQRRGLAARERRALHVAALRVVATRARVVNAPARAAELATSGALALERLERAGVPVVPWRLVPVASGERGWVALPLAAEHDAVAARTTAACEVDLGAHAPRAHLVVNGAWVAASEPDATLGVRLERSTSSATPAERELAAAALTALGLDFGEVHLAGSAVARVSAAPALAAWDHACAGAVAHALASLSSSPRPALATQ